MMLGFGSMLIGAVSTNWQNCILALRMDGANGSTTFTDLSNYQQPITVKGAADQSNAQSKWYSTSGDFPNSPGFDALQTTNSVTVTSGMTVQAWIYPTDSSASNETAIVINEAGSPYQIWLNIRSVANGGICCATNPLGGGAVVSASGQFTANAWQHVAAVIDGTSQRVYVNGIEYDRKTYSGTLMSNTPYIGIGGFAAGYDNFPYNGYMNDALVYNVALYDGDFTPPSGPFVVGAGVP